MASAPPPQSSLGVKSPEGTFRIGTMAPLPGPLVLPPRRPAVFGPPLVVGRPRGAVRRKTRRSTRKRLTKKRRV